MNGFSKHSQVKKRFWLVSEKSKKHLKHTEPPPVRVVQPSHLISAFTVPLPTLTDPQTWQSKDLIKIRGGGASEEQTLDNISVCW